MWKTVVIRIFRLNELIMQSFMSLAGDILTSCFSLFKSHKCDIIEMLN